MCDHCKSMEPRLEALYEQLLQEFPVNDEYLREHGIAVDNPEVRRPPADNRVVSGMIGIAMRHMLESGATHPQELAQYLMDALDAMVGHLYKNVPRDAFIVGLRILERREGETPKAALELFLDALERVSGIKMIHVDVTELDIDNNNIPLPPVDPTVKH
jgi:hypothetical protein